VEVRQVVNALEILEFFAERGRPATLGDLVNHFGWPKSSTFNLISTLLGRGYLFEPKARDGYYPSPLLLALAQKADRAWPVPQAMQDAIQFLSQETGETCVLAGVTGQSVIFLAVSESPQMVRYAPTVGYLMPLHATATGRALLSQLPAKERTGLLGRAQFHQFTDLTLMDATAVEREIGASLDRGYFLSKGEHVRDLGGVAMPLWFRSRHLAVLVAGPRDRIEKKESQIVEAMHLRLKEGMAKLQEPMAANDSLAA
jgi:IclR family acetate operon transcriptional repressor